MHEGIYLVNHTVPGEASVVNDDVDLAISKLRSLCNQVLDVVVVQDIARNSDGTAAGFVDVLCDICCLGFTCCQYPFDDDAATRRVLPASISATITLAPSFANNLAASAPIPWPEPVMMATWPASMPLGQFKWPAICCARDAIVNEMRTV